MRFSLQDIKKSVQRRKGELTLSLHLLRTSELTHEIAELIAYHERLLGQPQHLFSYDEARALIGDYRLAHCLIATLSHWYTWQHPLWQDAVSSLSPTSDFAGIVSPAQLRLELYNVVNEQYQGFLDSQHREHALLAFANRYALTVANLEYLLILDSDEETRLTRDSVEPPSPQEVATCYNQWAFEAALGSASSVHFTIDCNAFAALSGQVMGDSEPSTGTLTTGVGVAIKRLCYLARTIGVYYDLAYEPSLDGQHPLLSLTLYGPQEVTGVPQQYGIRLARLCRALLGYTKMSGKHKSPQLLNAILEASATVHLLQRAYAFNMSSELLRLLPSENEQKATANSSAHTHSMLFDSSIEQSFAEAFAALERSRAVDEWRLEREPEPLLLDQSIFIPDFALTRAKHRIYVEILGFWTPAYRERKVQKLQQLRGRGDILLAIPTVAKDAYTSILADFPIVFYDAQLSATDVLSVLRATYDDFAVRLASIDKNAVRVRVQQVGLLPEQACLELLHCYRRSEVQQAAMLVTNDDMTFTPGVGLYTETWLARIKHDFLASMQSAGTISLEAALAQLRILDTALQFSSDEQLEVLLAMWAELRIERDSIFDATLRLLVADTSSLLSEGRKDGLAHAGALEASVYEVTEPLESKHEKRVTTRRGTRKRLLKEAKGVKETAQEPLWE